ncbi:MAG: hypothetical protein NTV58_00190 [Deltaproteobacteria bacterium]|nr:hypothetical protein [Deltaproteobacteria bacterium]
MKGCFNCLNTLDISAKVGRREICPFCGKDLHVCLNCRFYDPQSYNACHEPQAERVIDKDRSNFCEYFSFREAALETDRPSAKEKLATLFK